MTTGARPGPFDVLVLGSGVAGLSAAVRLAGPGGPSPSLSAGRADQGRAVAVGHALGPGRRRRRARCRRGLDRPPPGRHAGGRGRAVRRGGGAHPRRRGAGPRARADRTGGRVRPGGHGLAGAGPRGRALPAPRRPRRRRRHRRRGGAGTRRCDLPLGQRRARGLVRPRPAGRGRPLRRRPGAAARRWRRARGGAGRPRGAGHWWRRAALLGHDQSARVDGRRRRHGAAGGRARRPTWSSCSSTPPRCTIRPCRGRCSPRRCAGHGALLRDRDGERFVDELAPRDVVSRAMAARMAEQGVDHLWLDATGLERFSARFPTIAASLASIGLDPQRDWLPIAPAAHHLSGGVVTDLWGATALPGLWAVGEVACTGVHGANRLASNSLLEGMVFGARLAERIPSGAPSPEPSGALRAVLGAEPHRRHRVHGVEHVGPTPPPPDADRWPGVDVTKLRDTVQRAMTRGAGVVRSAESLAGARVVVEEASAALGDPSASVAAGELGESAPAGRRAAGLRAGPHREPRRARPARVPRRRAVVAARVSSTAVARRRGAPWLKSTRRRTPMRCADAVGRALAEDLGPDGDLTSALVPEDVQAQFALRARRAGVLAGRACATETFLRVGPDIELRWLAADGDELAAGDTRAGAGRAAAADPHRRAHRAELPRAPLGRGHADRAVRHGGPREQPVGGRARHAQDDARPAAPGEGGGARRRWDQSPVRACPTPCW